MVKEICAHHWMIEAANGKKSSGICKHCGTSKEFFNSYDIPISTMLTISHSSLPMPSVCGRGSTTDSMRPTLRGIRIDRI